MKNLKFLFAVFFIASSIFCVSDSYTIQGMADKLGVENDRIKNSVTQVPSTVVYSYDCMTSDPFVMVGFIGYQTEIEMLKQMPGEVTIEQEMMYGAEMEKMLREEYTFLDNDQRLEALKELTEILLEARPLDKRKMLYNIHLIDDPTINAFTCGGHIFVFTGILKYCKSLSEIAFIIAHEIGHNEKFHLNHNLKRMMLAGEFADIAMTIKQLLGASFNQFNEVESDFYGVDLAKAAGFDPIKGATFWKRMSEDSDENPNAFDNFFRTHPYSMARYECLKVHLNKNYGIVMY